MLRPYWMDFVFSIHTTSRSDHISPLTQDQEEDTTTLRYLKQESQHYSADVDLEPVYDLAPPGGIFKGRSFLTHMLVGIHW